MLYLLDILLPGFGHIGSRRLATGILLVMLWAVAVAGSVLAASFDLLGLVAVGACHGLLAAVACLDLRRLRRQGITARPGCLKGVALLAAASAFALALLFTMSSFVVRPIVIRSGSMEPGIWTGDTVAAQIFWPVLGRASLGDVVLVAHPRLRGRLLLKRIIGIAGDLIEVRGGEIYRNGRPLAQCSLRQLRDPESRQQVVERLEVLDQRPYLVWDQLATVSPALRTRVQPGHVFVLGDNRDRSGDSRSFGAVPIASIRARIRVGLAPLRNRVDRAPLGARQAAFAQCARRREAGRRAPSER